MLGSTQLLTAMKCRFNCKVLSQRYVTAIKSSALLLLTCAARASSPSGDGERGHFTYRCSKRSGIQELSKEKLAGITASGKRGRGRVTALLSPSPFLPMFPLRSPFHAPLSYGHLTDQSPSKVLAL